MAEPEFLICINCETPCYTFEWQGSAPTEAQCMMCGAEDLDEFCTEEEFDAMSAAE
jgi:hypothetical protein